MKHIALYLFVASLAMNFTTEFSAQTMCENGFAGDYACDGYDLYTYFPLSAVGGGDNGNDCWGWVDSESGREFVLFGRSDGMSVVKLRTHLRPLTSRTSRLHHLHLFGETLR